jgi:hypothetical protein
VQCSAVQCSEGLWDGGMVCGEALAAPFSFLPGPRSSSSPGGGSEGAGCEPGACGDGVWPLSSGGGRANGEVWLLPSPDFSSSSEKISPSRKGLWTLSHIIITL